MSEPTHEELERYADLALRIGLDLQPGQPLLIRSPLAGAPLARSVAACAYRLGSGDVSVIYSDAEVSRARIRWASDGALDSYPAWQAHALNEAGPSGTAVLSIVAEDPDVYAGEDPQRVARVQRAARTHLTPFYRCVSRTDLNWCVVALPVPLWASKVYSEAAPAESLRRLWEAVKTAVRLDRADPVAAWQDHIEALQARASHLTSRAFDALHYRGPRTDLRVGLAEGHVWAGPRANAPTGAAFVANIPTEEVFTAPHRERVEGTVHATRPLSHGGRIVDGFWLRFADGAVVEAGAERGADVLHQILETDEGARRLGEVALVAASNPVARAGVLYFDTLFDENAASHLALGRAYAFTVRDGATMDEDALASRGVNASLTHVDFMIGSDEMDVDGQRGDGAIEPVMRSGEFVI